MIAKLKAILDVAPVIEYNESKVEKGEAERFYNNTFFDSKEDLINEFNEVAALNDKVKSNKFMHIPVSFPVGERPGRQKATEILEDYLKEMGYKNRPTLIYQHNDTDKLHFHIVIPTVDYEGIKTKENYNYRLNEKVTRALEIKYGLTPTVYNLQSTKETDVDIRLNRISKSIKNIPRKLAGEILQELNIDFDIVKASSNKDIKRKIGEVKYQKLYNELQTNDLLVFSNLERLRFELTGLKRKSKDAAEFIKNVKDSGYYFRLLKDPIKGNSVSFGHQLPDGKMQYFSGDKIGKNFTYKSLYQNQAGQDNIKMAHPDKSQESELSNRKRYVASIFRIIQTSTSMEEFMTRTTAAGIVAMPVTNSSGYSGMSFKIGEETFKASELHRNLSINKIINRISINSIQTDQIISPKKEKQSAQSYIPNVADGNNDHSDEEKERLKKKQREKEESKGQSFN
jgi:hypothetical protein